MAATKNISMYLALNATAYTLLVVPATEQANVEAAIQSGDWWTNPAKPNEHWNLAGVARYVVSG